MDKHTTTLGHDIIDKTTKSKGDNGYKYMDRQSKEKDKDKVRQTTKDGHRKRTQTKQCKPTSIASSADSFELIDESRRTQRDTSTHTHSPTSRARAT